jgi:ABC-type transporter MlaC component
MQLSTRVCSWIPLTAAGLLAVSTAHASPAQQSEKLIKAFQAVKWVKAGQKLSEADRAANQKAYVALDRFFDFESFTKSCRGPTPLTPAQAALFQARLTDILRRRGYKNGGRVFNEGKITLGKAATGKPATQGTAIPMTISFPKEDITLAIAFVWKSERVVDLVIDGDSLTADFSNQVGRVVKKSGADKLLTLLADKQKALDQDGL